MENYNKKKRKNQILKNLIKKHVSKEHMNLIEECSSFLNFIADKDLSKKKLVNHNGCNNRFCPVCAWRKARKDALMLSLLMEHIKLAEDKEFLFLTLTSPNVAAADLKTEIDKFNLSFKNLMKRKEVLKVSKGYVRKLELTYNAQTDTYHPHFHVIIATNKSYFKDTKVYISQKTWLSLWQKVNKDFSITQVDIRKIKANNGKEILELAKYGAKDSDYLSSQKVFDVFYKNLKGRQILVFSGLFNSVKKKFENGELDYLKEVDLTQYIYKIFCLWNKKEYIENEIRYLNEEEKERYNSKLFDEIEVE